MIDSVKFKIFLLFKLICVVGVAASLVLLTVPFSAAAPARVSSALPEPEPYKIVNNDGTTTYRVYVLRGATDGTDEQNKSVLFEMVFTVETSYPVALNLGSQNGSAVNTTSSTGNSISTSFDVVSGSQESVYVRNDPNHIASYMIASGYTGGFQFLNSYFPRSWSHLTGPSVFVHAWVPEGCSLINNLGSYYVDNWVDWAVDPVENIFYSHLDRPVQDQFNRYLVAYNRKSKEGILIHFNVAVSGVFSGFNDYVTTLTDSSGSLDLSSFVANSQGYYDSTGQYYQTTFDSNGDTIDFTLSNGSLSLSGNVNQWIDGSIFSPVLDLSSGSENWSLNVPSIIYSRYGDFASHINVYVSIYNLLDGKLKNQFIFDSVLSNSNSLSLDIGTPLIALGATHILTFGTIYKPNLQNGFNWGSVVWGVDPVVTQWRSDISGKLDSIIALLRDAGGDEPTTISRDLASGLAQAEEALQPKDANGNPLDVAAEAQRVFDDSLDSIDELSPGSQYINSTLSFLSEEPIVLLPVIVALTLGLLITIIGKNKSG